MKTEQEDCGVDSRLQKDQELEYFGKESTDACSACTDGCMCMYRWVHVIFHSVGKESADACSCMYRWVHVIFHSVGKEITDACSCMYRWVHVHVPMGACSLSFGGKGDYGCVLLHVPMSTCYHSFVKDAHKNSKVTAVQFTAS